MMWPMISALASLSSVAITAMGLMFASGQIIEARRFSRAQFINELEKDMEARYNTYIKNLPEQFWWAESKTDYSLKEKIEISCYLNFFEKLKLMLENGAIELSEVDRLFSYRFFFIVHNEGVQTQLLYHDQYKDYFASVFALHQDWIVYRKARDLPILSESTSLRVANEGHYDAQIKIYYQTIE